MRDITQRVARSMRLATCAPPPPGGCSVPPKDHDQVVVDRFHPALYATRTG